jgi:hypothetical protein
MRTEIKRADAERQAPQRSHRGVTTPGQIVKVVADSVAGVYVVTGSVTVTIVAGVLAVTLAGWLALLRR